MSGRGPYTRTQRSGNRGFPGNGPSGEMRKIVAIEFGFQHSDDSDRIFVFDGPVLSPAKRYLGVVYPTALDMWTGETPGGVAVGGYRTREECAEKLLAYRGSNG